MPDSKLELEGDFQAGKTGLQRHDLMLQWKGALIGDRAICGPGLEETETPNGRIVRVSIDLQSLCPFGVISAGPGANQASISGGSVTAGPDLHDVQPHAISTATDGNSLVWLSVSVVANVQDGLVMPGLNSSSAPTWGEGASYPPQTIPTALSPSGIAIVPIGSVTIAGGVATLAPTGCGSLIVNHCPGSLSASRA